MVIKRLVFLTTSAMILLFGWVMLFYVFPEIYLWFGSRTSDDHNIQVNNKNQSEEGSLLTRNLSPLIPNNSAVNIALESEAEVTNTDFIVFEGEQEDEELQTQVLVPGEYQSREYLRTWGWLKQHKIDFKTLSDSELLEKLARVKAERRLFNGAGDNQKANEWANAIQSIDQQQGVGKYLIPYPLNLFEDPWSPTETLMSKNLGEVENQLVYVLKELIDRKAFFNDDEQNAYQELKKLVPEP